MNPYAELGVAPDATLEQINAAFRCRARTAHPDAGGDPDTFRRLSDAVALLRDENRRHLYDETGSTDERKPDEGARDLLLQVIQQVLTEPGGMGGRPDWARMDVIERAKKALRQSLQMLDVNRHNGLAEQRRIADAITRVTYKGDGPDFLTGMLEQQAEAIGRGLAQLDEHEAQAKAALALADQFEWRRDEPPAAKVRMGGIDGAALQQAFFGTGTTTNATY